MKELALYEKRLTQALCCPPALRKRLLTNTREMAQDFLAGKPDATWEDMEKFLGDPQELAQTMLEAENQEALARYRKRKLWLKRGFIGAIIAVLLGSSIFFYCTRMNIVITETLVIYETEEPEEDISSQSP